MRSAVDAFVAHQSASGRVFDFVTKLPTAGSSERENWEKWIRVPVEADVEYRLVNAAFHTWQANGDNEWIEKHIPALGKAIEYSTSHPWRWDTRYNLVKRAYTIDTWDFDYTAGKHDWLNFQITDDTFWGIMHGDNSGVFQAIQRLALICQECGHTEKASALLEQADGLRQRANDLLFNGQFYKHFFKLSKVSIDGVDEDAQLSLSNPMDINRGLATPEIADAIVRTYRKREAENDTFAAWYSIDPPFPNGTFGDDKLVPGSYCNGGIMPLVGGELARAALENGHEDYGVGILEKYRTMIEEAGETYLWYFPNGEHSTVENSTSPEAMPTDGWGSSAMLWAFVEGLAGVQDQRSKFSHVRFSPKWLAAGENSASFEISYPVSGSSFKYDFEHDGEARVLKYTVGSQSNLQCQIMLPDGYRAEGVAVDGSAVSFSNIRVGENQYAKFECMTEDNTEITIRYGI